MITWRAHVYTLQRRSHSKSEVVPGNWWLTVHMYGMTTPETTQLITDRKVSSTYMWVCDIDSEWHTTIAVRLDQMPRVRIVRPNFYTTLT